MTLNYCTGQPDIEPAQQPLSEEQEREAFEAWVLQTYSTVSREHGKLRWYETAVGTAVGHAWGAWQARAAHGIGGEK